MILLVISYPALAKSENAGDKFTLLGIAILATIVALKICAIEVENEFLIKRFPGIDKWVQRGLTQQFIAACTIHTAKAITDNVEVFAGQRIVQYVAAGLLMACGIVYFIAGIPHDSHDAYRKRLLTDIKEEEAAIATLEVQLREAAPDEKAAVLSTLQDVETKYHHSRDDLAEADSKTTKGGRDKGSKRSKHQTHHRRQSRRQQPIQIIINNQPGGATVASTAAIDTIQQQQQQLTNPTVDSVQELQLTDNPALSRPPRPATVPMQPISSLPRFGETLPKSADYPFPETRPALRPLTAQGMPLSKMKPAEFAAMLESLTTLVPESAL